jgi:GDP-4-dehydro-6-deoxy-D-mannose reductase
MHTLITGSNGFIAQYLIKELKTHKYVVAGISRTANNDSSITSYSGDVTDMSLVNKVIKREKPSSIFHLAAQSSILYSFEHPQETVATNIGGILNVLEAIKGTDTTLLSVGSSAEYGQTASGNHQISEEAVLKPSSPYAISKVCQGEFVRMYRNAYKVKAIHIRPFAIIGPHKKGDALSDFAKGIVQIEKGKKKYLEVGDVSTVRDFLDVRDAVRAMIMISKSGQSYDTMNLCSGQGVTLSDLLDMLIHHAKTKIIVKMNTVKKRPLDDRIIVGDPSRLFSLGFKPQVPLEQTVQDILHYWRENS